MIELRKPLRSYGRRKGRKLTKHRLGLLTSLLPRLRLDMSSPPPEPAAKLFAVPVDDIWLEIGFGGGEHLAEQARRNPRVGFIGAEPYLNGVAKLLAEIESAGLKNIRILDDDGRPLFDWLPPQSLGRVFILFPDPWPKRRHAERRIVNPATVEALSRAMRLGGLLRLATDIEPYADMAKEVIVEAGFFQLVDRPLLQRPDDWIVTRYEAKAIAAGRRCLYLDFARSAP